MNPSAPHSESVWRSTVPALNRHRRRRCWTRGSVTTVLLAGLVGAFTWRSSEPVTTPEAPPTIAVTLPKPPEPAPSSLAVLIVSAEGTHFEQLRPEDLSLEGVEFDLSLEPVITGRIY